MSSAVLLDASERYHFTTLSVCKTWKSALCMNRHERSAHPPGLVKCPCFIGLLCVIARVQLPDWLPDREDALISKAIEDKIPI